MQLCQLRVVVINVRWLSEWMSEWHKIQVILCLYSSQPWLVLRNLLQVQCVIVSVNSVSCCICGIQVITLKLIVVMSLNIRIMTSHDHTCVQCVRNGLQGNTYWEITYSYTVENSCIHVLSVRNDFYLTAHWTCIWMFTAVNTGAVNVESVVSANIS